MVGRAQWGLHQQSHLSWRKKLCIQVLITLIDVSRCRVGDKWTVKARGFTLGEDTLHVLNGTAMERQLRAFVFENKEDVIYVHQKRFKRSKMMEITTVDVSKKHKVVMDKRAIMFADDHLVVTKPFGFVYFPGCFIL